MDKANLNTNCPFCGGEPILMWRDSYKGRLGWVECMTCGGRTRAKRVYGSIDDEDFYDQDAYKELFALWMRRPVEE